MDTWLLLLIIFPVVCAVIGYVTNVLAVKMIFHPHHPRKVLGLTFQGVLPKHQRHFARMLAGIIVRDFMDTRALVRTLNHPKVVGRLETAARPLAKQLVAALAEDLPSTQSALLTPQVTDMLIEQVISNVKAQAPQIVELMAERADDAINLKDIIAEKIVSLGPSGLERIIYEVSKKELDFIEYYGAIFGFALGLFQYGVLYLFGDIALPIVGALVGTITNWLAIQMLFYPREPTKYLFGLVTYQGLFPKRQSEIATKMGAIAANELIVPEEVFALILDRVVPNELTASQLETFEGYVREQMPMIMTALDSMLAPEERPAFRERLAARLTPMIPALRDQFVQVAVAEVDIHSTLEKRIAELPSTEFEALLRGLFQREEIYLIIYGGVLGGLIGGIQLLIVKSLGVW